jgi:hypothetical protein
LVQELEPAGRHLLPKTLSPEHNDPAGHARGSSARSDLPVLSDPAWRRFRAWRSGPDAGNVTLLERPVRGATFLSAIRTALRSRERQRDPRHLEDRGAPKSLRIADQRKDEFLATLGHELRNRSRRW